MCQSAATWDRPADRVLCVGAAHAWPGTAETLAALAGLTRPGGRLLFGDGYWERPPTEAAAALFGDDVRPLGALVAQAGAAGWRVLHMSCADQREWDAFESTWRAGQEEWCLRHPTAPQAEEVRRHLDARLSEYVDVYRGVLGFCYLVLGR